MTTSTDVSALPLARLSDFAYRGGFALPGDEYGASSMNYSDAVFTVSNSSLFIVGHVQDDAIAEFVLPELGTGDSIESLPSAGAPVQRFSKVLDRSGVDNSESLDVISGMDVYQDKLIVNGLNYYDASASVSDTTLVIEDASNLASSSVTAFLKLPGGARSAGWLTELPPEWQAELEATHLVGNSSGTPIISRHSVGPSFHSLNAQDIVDATPGSGVIPTTKLMEFSLDKPLNSDLYNESLTNDIWTIAGGAKFGFIVPGTRTYATFGSMEGTDSGLGYKITQNDGTVCGGPCSYDAADRHNYYWFWDMNDLLSVRAGERESYEITPYAYGKFEVPFQGTGSGHHDIGGASFDAASGTLYFSVNNANNTLGPYSNPPVIVAYDVGDQ